MAREPLWFYVLIICILPLLFPAIIAYTFRLLWGMLVDKFMISRRRLERVTRCPILPRELWHIIFAECGDRSTLLACSLVCTAWTSISRDQLRLKMSLNNYERNALLIHLLRSPVQTLTRGTICASFRGLKPNQHWRIIRLLHLHRTQLCRAIIIGDAHVTGHLLFYFCDTLVDLTFENNVSSVCLCGGVHPTRELADFLSLVSGFKHLRSLSLKIEYHEPLELVHSGVPLPIDRLSVSGIWSSDLLDWLDSACKRLVALELLGKTGWGREVISTEIMLKANAETLRHLQLTVPAMNAPLNLAIVKNLRNLVLLLTDDSSACFDCAVKTLRSLRPLKEVRVKKASPACSFSGRKVSVISEILGKLGMTLIRDGYFCSTCTLEFVYVERRVEL